MSLIKFKIPARARKCLTCDEKFAEESKIFSTVEGSEEEPQRKDYCEKCFHQHPLSGAVWGHWYLVLKKSKAKLSPDQRAMELFEQAQIQDDAEYLLFLAQYLKRKHQLVQRPEIKREEHLFFENPKTSEVYGILKTSIDPNKLKELKERFLNELSDDQ